MDIFNNYRRNSRITSDGYIDPNGHNFDSRLIVVCNECMFGYGTSGCVLYKEMGKSDIEIEKKNMQVFSSNYCEYFLYRNYSEVGNEDERVRKRVLDIGKKLGYSSYTHDGISSSESKNSYDWIWGVIFITIFLFFLIF